MKIFGIDPGIEKLGWAVLEVEKGEVKKIFSGLIKTNSSSSLSKRLEQIYKKLKKILEKYQPDLLTMEDLFYFKNKKTVIKVAQAQGIVFLLSNQLKIPVKILSPLQIKKAITGYGRADKKAIEKMVYLRLPLKKGKREDDELDAIACAFSGALIFQNNEMIGK